MSIKYRTSAGTSASDFTDLVVKVGDTLPIGTEVDYDGQTAPAGWQEVAETNLGDVVVDSIRAKNLLPIKYLSSWQCTYSIGENSIIVHSTATSGVAFVKLSPIKLPVGTYTISFTSTGQLQQIAFLDISGGTISQTANITSTTTFTITGETTTFSVAIYVNASSTANEVTVKNLQIEKGSTATDYAPYQNLNGETYSTNEVRIGTWIDGKPIYRKVYTGTLTGETTNYNYAEFYLPTTIETLVRLNGSMKTNNSNAHWVKSLPANAIDINYFYNEGTGRTRLYGTNKTEMVITSTSYVVIAEYTKTTD